MKLFYLSSSAFVDNQMAILKYIPKHISIVYAIIFPSYNSNYTEQELNNYCEINGIKFYPFNLKYRFRDPRLIKTYMSIINAVKKEDPDIIYFSNFDQLYLNILLLLLNRSKTIIALHDVESHSGITFSNLVNLSKRLLIINFKYFHTYSRIQHQLLKTIIPNKNIYNISLPLIDFGPKLLNENEDDIINFLFFGNILYYKGLDLLLTAFNHVSEKYSNVRLTIAGRCDDWEINYAPQVQDSALINSVIRFIANDEIPILFSNTDYVVLPYRDTTQSGPLMIAYNYNIPVLVSSAEGFKEFTEEGVTGYSFRLDVSGELEYLLEACVERSKQEYEELKNKQAAYIEDNFSISVIISKYNMMFSSVVSSQ